MNETTPTNDAATPIRSFRSVKFRADTNCDCCERGIRRGDDGFASTVQIACSKFCADALEDGEG